MTAVRKNCEYCGVVFNITPAKLKTGRGKYCSRGCLSIAMKFGHRLETTCLQCGEKFKYHESEGERKYCSFVCYSQRAPLVQRKCEICGKDFEIHPYRMEDGTGIYCSQTCFGISRRGVVSPTKGKPSPFRGIPRTEETKRKMSESRKGMTYQVSEKSINVLVEYNKTRKGVPGRKHTEETKQKLAMHFRGLKRPELSGENHPMWKGGVAYQPYCVKFNNRFKMRVRTFFKNRCVLCGKTQEENVNQLSVHHIHENKNTCCDKSVPMFAALCISCHRAVHTGKREAWISFFENIINNRYGGQSYFTEEEYQEITCYP